MARNDLRRSASADVVVAVARDSSCMALVGCATLVFLLPALFFGLLMLPKRETMQRLPSADGRYQLVVFSTDAGATTSTTYWIAVTRAGREPFRGDAFFAANRSSGPPKVQWRGSRRIAVTLPLPCDVFRRADEGWAGGVRFGVDYE